MVMAPLLRARFFRLVSSFHQELRQLPESHCVVRRSYGGNAVLEETQPASNIAVAATTRADTAPEMIGVTEECEGPKETLQTSNAKQDGIADQFSALQSDTDKITRLVLDKLRSKKAADGAPLQKELLSGKNKSVEELSEKDDKWAQVLSSMQKMAAKNRMSLKVGADGCGDGDQSRPMSGGSGGSSMSSMLTSQNAIGDDFSDLDEKSGLEDDFADLDTPQGYGESGPAKGMMPQRPSVDMFSVSNKHKNGSFQGQFNKQKAGMSLSSSDAKQRGMGFKLFGETKSKDTKPTKVPQAADVPHHPVSFFDVLARESKGSSSGLEREDNMPSETLLNANNVCTVPPVLGFTACVENLPTHCNLALVKEALSIHGEIISSFKKYNQDKTCSTYIEFMLAEALDSALASGFLQFDGKAFSIIGVKPPITTVVRLSKVSEETSENQLLSICSKFGGIDNIRRRANGVYDVFYKVHELPNIPRILNNLSTVMLKQSRLVAVPAPLLHPAVKRDVLRSSEGLEWHALQVSQLLSQIEGGLDRVSVSFGDLKALTAMGDELVS